MSNAQQSFQIGEGRLVKYNFSDIQKDFCDCFMFDKPSIENDLDVRVTESRLFDNLKTIQINISQVSSILFIPYIIVYLSLHCISCFPLSCHCDNVTVICRKKYQKTFGIVLKKD